MIINIKQTIETKFAIKEEKGNILYEKLKELLEQGEKNIELDFSDITASTTRFFNVSVGKLYSEFPFEIVHNIKIENANHLLYSRLEVSKNGAKEFYSHKWL